MGPRGAGAGREGGSRMGFRDSGTDGVRWVRAVKRSASDWVKDVVVVQPTEAMPRAASILNLLSCALQGL